MSDTNESALFYAPETAFAETPTLASKLQQIYFTGEDLKHNNMIQESESIRGDRQIEQTPRVGMSAAGNINVELQAAAYNDFLAAGLSSVWVTTADTVTVTVAGQVMTATTGTFSAATQKARYVKLSNMATPGNNGIKKVVSCTSTVLTLAAGSLTGSDTGDVCTVASKYVQNGLLLPTFLIEKLFVGADNGSDRYQYFTGCAVSEIGFTLDSKSKARAQFGMMASRGFYSATTKGDGAPTALNTNPILTTNAAISTIYEAGIAIPTPVQALPFKISNGLRSRDFLGSDVSRSWGKNDFRCTGNLRAYFERKEMADKIMSQEDTSLEFAIYDLAGRMTNFHMPRVTLLNGNPNSNAKNADVITDIEFQAKGSNTGKTLQIDYLEP